MHLFPVRPAVFFALIATLAAGQTAPAPGTTELYRNDAIVFEQYDSTIRMHADGTGDRTLHVRVRVQSEGAAREFSVLSLPFASAYETGNIDYIRVVKADGTKIETPTKDVIEMPAPVTREAPLYSDLKEVQLPVRSLAAGDTLEYQLRAVKTKAEVPRQFWGAEHLFSTGTVILSQTLTLEVPSGMYVQVWDPKHPTQPVDRKGVRTYRWTSSQLKPSGPAKDGDKEQGGAKVEATKDPDQDSDGRQLPSVAWTTFHSWAEVGDWYRALALPRSEPTEAIRSRANELTKDAKMPEEQIRALYSFVSLRTRYVGIDLGIGRYQPHKAEEVMEYQYGDCKDKDTLLEALLRAKGFTTAPALIGVNVAPVPEVPSPAIFNHVITTVELPGGRVWLDTTPEVAPYRVLVPAIRDEEALVVPANGAASLQRTPADPPFAYFERFEAVGTLGADGMLKSHMEITSRSDAEFGYRMLLQRAAPAQWDEAMQAVSRALGFGGTVSHADLHQTDALGPVHLGYDYNRPEFGDWANHRILPLFPTVDVTVIDKEKEPEQDVDQGTPRTLEATTRIKLPPGYRAELPDGKHVKRPYATFDQTYRLENGELVMQRKIVILKKKVPRAEWKDYLAYTKATGVEEGENYVSLMLAPAKDVEHLTVPVTGKPTVHAESSAGKAGTDVKDRSSTAGESVANASSAQKMEDARQLEMAGDWSSARRKLDEISTVDSNYPYLQSMYGYLDLHDGKPDQAIKKFQAELKGHPEADSGIVILLAGAYSSNKQQKEAVELLKSYSKRNDLRISMVLGQLETQMGDSAGAVETMQAALDGHPNDAEVRTNLASALHRAERNTEAAAVAKAAMDGSDDANVLNNNAYLLAEVKIDLPAAEKNARHAVDLLESSSMLGSVQEANSKAFLQSSSLVATWDTLGWILFLEGKPAEAEPYLAAAWFNEPRLVVGDHLARVREAMGKSSEALTIEEIALVTEGASSDEKERGEVKAEIERLRKSGAHSSAGDPVKTLQEMRMFRVKRPASLNGWGTFRVQLGGRGVRESQLVSGSDAMRPMTAAVNKIEIAGALPPGSQARLLRDGVLSCSEGQATCEFVLMPHAGLGAEAVQ